MPADLPARNFLFATWEGGGSVTPALTVVRKLVAAGHRVRVMSDACNRPEAEAAGAVFIPWTRAPSRPDRRKETDMMRDWEADSPQAAIVRVIDCIIAGPALAYACDIIAELEREPADLVVSSDMLLGVMAGCEAVGQKFVLLACNVSLYPIPGVPPIGPGLLPARTDEERAMEAEFRAGAIAMFDHGLPALNDARATLGLPPLASIVDQVGAARATLLGTSRAFDFAAEEDAPGIHYVGPQLDDPAWAQAWQSPFDEGDDRPLVLVGFSTTFQDHAGVLQRVIDALATLPVRALVTLGDTIGTEQLSPAANVRLVHSAPHNAVMREAALVVTHGGHGTVTRALVHKLPLLVIPHGRDQHDNAARVVARGAGLSLMPAAATADIRAALEQLLGDPAHARSAFDLGMLVEDEMRNSPVVDHLEALARFPVGERAAVMERTAAPLACV